jgi:hypothetical protein
MKKKSYALFILIGTLFVITIPGVTMGFRPFQICLFSEVNAVLTLQGKPVAGAEIVRTANQLNSKVYTDKTTTDAQGRFHFAARYIFSLSNFIPAEPVIVQRMTIHYQGEKYLGWEGVRSNYGKNNELDGDKPIKLTCELTEEPTLKYQERRGNIEGICKW